MFRCLAAVATAILVSPVGAFAAWKEHPAAVQTVYQDHVPHTDRTGRPMERFDAGRSFFPLVLYHALQGEHEGIRYELKDDATAGFNACMPYEGQDPRALAEAAEKAKVQLIVHGPSDEVVKALARSPAVLGWYLDEEPTSNDQGPQMESHFAAFVHRREQIRAIDPGHPVFALDVGMAPSPRPGYGLGLVATADQLQMSRALWDEAMTINKEIASLRPALLSPTEKIRYDVALDDAWPSITPDPIRTLLKHDPAGGSIMLIVNIDSAPVHVRIGCKGFTAEQQFEAAGAGSFLATAGGFEITCTPYDVRIVHLTPRN